VDKAIENFIKNGEIIANENSDIQQDLHAAVNEVKISGKNPKKFSTNLLTSQIFSSDLNYYYFRKNYDRRISRICR